MRYYLLPKKQSLLSKLESKHFYAFFDSTKLELYNSCYIKTFSHNIKCFSTTMILNLYYHPGRILSCLFLNLLSRDPKSIHDVG
jgi:hypothetical protein